MILGRCSNCTVCTVLTWDASPLGRAALVRWWGVKGGRRALSEQLPVGTWQDGEDVEEQAHRECLAALLALEAAGVRRTAR